MGKKAKERRNQRQASKTSCLTKKAKVQSGTATHKRQSILVPQHQLKGQRKKKPVAAPRFGGPSAEKLALKARRAEEEAASGAAW